MVEMWKGFKISERTSLNIGRNILETEQCRDKGLSSVF